MRAFDAARALDSKSAKPLSEIGVRNSFLFQRMVRRDVFVAAAAGAYYMDRAAAERFRRSRRLRVIIGTIAVLGVGILFAWLAF